MINNIFSRLFPSPTLAYDGGAGSKLEPKQYNQRPVSTKKGLPLPQFLEARGSFRDGLIDNTRTEEPNLEDSFFRLSRTITPSDRVDLSNYDSPPINSTPSLPQLFKSIIENYITLHPNDVESINLIKRDGELAMKAIQESWQSKDLQPIFKLSLFSKFFLPQ